MPDDTDYEDASKQALQSAAEYIRDRVSERSPSRKIGALWRLIRRGNAIYVRNSGIAAEMTDFNKRHPLFGNKKHWYSENQRNPDRTGWAGKAIEDSADEAEEKFSDTYLQRIAVTSKYFDYNRNGDGSSRSML